MMHCQELEDWNNDIERDKAGKGRIFDNDALA